MGTGGGRVITTILNKLAEDIEEYYGQLNEYRLGVTGKVPKKPDEVGIYEQVKATGLPLIAGGYADQPYVWLEIFAVVGSLMTLYETLFRNSNPNVST